MSEVKNPSRREKAAETKSRIIRAAHDEFLQAGYQGATMAAIAARAGVATQTVYFIFHTKADLISAVIDTAVLGDDEPVAPMATAWWQQMLDAPTAAEACGIFLRGAIPLLERASGVSEVLRAAALTDEDVRRTHDFHAKMQADGYRQVIDVMAAKGRLHDHLTPETATDLLLVFAGDTFYYLLRTERGWSQDETSAWLVRSVPPLLVTDD